MSKQLSPGKPILTNSSTINKSAVSSTPEKLLTYMRKRISREWQPHWQSSWRSKAYRRAKRTYTWLSSRNSGSTATSSFACLQLEINSELDAETSRRWWTAVHLTGSTTGPSRHCELFQFSSSRRTWWSKMTITWGRPSLKCSPRFTTASKSLQSDSTTSRREESTSPRRLISMLWTYSDNS